jgi:transposase
MDVLYPRCAGLDVHKAIIVACVRTMVGAKTTRACRSFETSTTGLQSLLAWLTEQGCTHVAMEATGSTGSRSGTS